MLAEALRVDQRGPAFAERQRLLAVEERHQLAVAPHVRRPAGSAMTSQARAASRS